MSKVDAINGNGSVDRFERYKQQLKLRTEKFIQTNYGMYPRSGAIKAENLPNLLNGSERPQSA